MALKEQDIVFYEEDADGNKIIQLPITRVENLEGVLPIEKGGTGAINANDACDNLGAVKHEGANNYNGTIINGGINWENGAGLFLAGKENETIGIKGGFALHAQSDAGEASLSGNPDGNLFWKNCIVDTIAIKGNNYIKYTSGLIIQWGRFAPCTNGSIVTFPIPFSNVNYGKLISSNDPDSNFPAIATCEVNATSMIIYTTKSVGMNWFAIGY